MKKHLFALALGITTALSALPVMPVQALDPPMPGDVNHDWIVNVSDLVCLQRYLLGAGELDWVYGTYSADVNNDGSIDIFDYIEIRKMVERPENKPEYRFTQVDESFPVGSTYDRPNDNNEAVIESVEELKQYLAPYEVFLTDGGCMTMDAASQEVIDDMLERYDEAFFNKNVLLLNYLRGTGGYEFESIKYDDSTLVIKYYDTSDELYYNPLPPYIAEVAVPEKLWADGKVVWEEVDAPSDEIKSRFTRCDESIPQGVRYGKQPFDSEAVIKSVEELEKYFQPYSVITTTGECIFVDVASQEVIDDFLVRYDEKFFSKNVLLLNYLKGVDKYEFESIQYEDSALVIKYYDATDPNLTWTNPLPPYIAEVAVPEKLWTGSEVIWEETDVPFTPEIKSDFTNEINNEAVINAFSETSPQVITSSDELSEYLDGKFHTGVEMSLKDTYNDEFFENNVLILDLSYQSYRQDWTTSLSVSKDKYNNLVLTYDRLFINGFVDTGVQINQIVIPEKQYRFTDVLKEKTWETPADVSYTCFDLFQIAQMTDCDDSAIKSYSKEGAWVNSAEEMTEYFSDCFTDTISEFLEPVVSGTDWDKKSVYIWLDTDVIGSTHRLISSAETDGKINLTITNKQPLSCMGGSFLHIATTDKKNSGKATGIQNINMNDDMPHTSGEYNILQFGSDAVMVNQYTFGSKNVADIYRLHTGGGPVQFSGYTYIGTVEFAEDYFPVKSESDNITYAEGEKTVMESENYRIEIENQKLKFIYKYSADSEYTEKAFDY